MANPLRLVFKKGERRKKDNFLGMGAEVFRRLKLSDYLRLLLIRFGVGSNAVTRLMSTVTQRECVSVTDCDSLCQQPAVT